MSDIATAATTTTATAERVLVPRLVEGATCTLQPGGRLKFGSPGASATLPPLPAPLTDVFLALKGNTSTLEELIERLEREGHAGLSTSFSVHTARFSSQGLLTYHLTVDGEELATIEPAGMSYRFLIQPIPDSSPVRLSRFTVMRREEDHMVLESGLSHATTRILHPSLMAIVATMVTAPTPASLRTQADALGLSPDAVSGLLVMLLNGKLLETPAETDSEDLALWNPYDLLFHSSSRYGRLGGAFGGNFQHIGEMEPAPALRPLPEGTRIPLPVPVLEEIRHHDPPLQAVIEERRSIYSYAPEPLTLEDLGEFLFRTARVRWKGRQEVTSSVTGRQGEMEITSRPTPAGGRGYELELYLTISVCEGLDPGMYHYDPAGHQLTLIRPADFHTDQMLAFASVASPGVEPQILITLAARFRRMMWKYDRLAYAATLKHVGVMFQQMYLVATAMHLAPSGLGSGNIETFAAASGNDPQVEGSVGEFILGSSLRAPRGFRPSMMYPEASE